MIYWPKCIFFFFFLDQLEKVENLENAINSHGQIRFFDELGCKYNIIIFNNVVFHMIINNINN